MESLQSLQDIGEVSSGEGATLVELLKETARLEKVIDPESLFSTKISRDYLDKVSNLSLEAVLQEPNIISEEASFVAGELTSLCFREYRTFISVHKITEDVKGAFDEFSSSLDSLLLSVPLLEEECHAFAQSTRSIQATRRSAALVLEHHDKLMDLLEAPQLLETCVRNGYWAEAMELARWVRGLVSKQQQNKSLAHFAIVQDVGREVEKAMEGMRAQLLAILREPNKLPQLAKAIGFLRRMGDLSEPELQIAFLSSRSFNYKTQLTGLERERGDPVRYVRRYVDLFRENVYDIISQFTSIFLSKDTPDTNYSVELITTFAHQSLAHLLSTLDGQIPLVDDPASLSSLLTQLGYCAISFTRVGLDFRELISRPFEKAVVDATIKSMSEAMSGLDQVIRDAVKVNKAPPKWICLPTFNPSIATNQPLNSHTSIPNSTSSSIYAPPPALTTFPPLALFANAHINTLNSLRLLSPLAVFEDLVSAQDKSLDEVSSLVLEYCKTSITSHHGNQSHQATGWQTEASTSAALADLKHTQLVMLEFAKTYSEALVPFLQKGLIEGVYGGELGTTEDVIGANIRNDVKSARHQLDEWIQSTINELHPVPVAIEEDKAADDDSLVVEESGVETPEEGDMADGDLEKEIDEVIAPAVAAKELSDESVDVNSRAVNELISES